MILSGPFVERNDVNHVMSADALKLDFAGLCAIDQDYGCLNLVDCFSDFAVTKFMNGDSRK